MSDVSRDTVQKLGRKLYETQRDAGNTKLTQEQATQRIRDAVSSGDRKRANDNR